MKEKVISFFDKIQDYIFVQAMRRALISLIPILMIGSFAVLFSALPIEAYTTFITTWNEGLIYNLFITMHNVTIGIISIYMAGMIGYHIGILNSGVEAEKKYGTMLISVGTFCILSGAVNGETAAFGAEGMFLAIIAAEIGSGLYILIARRMKGKLILADGADMNLRSAIQSILPALFAFGVIALANNVILKFIEEDCIYEWMIHLMSNAFGKLGGGLAGGLIYVVLNCILWFFGIHGSDVLEGVSESMFQAAIQQNIILAQNGQVATEIVTRQFINSFVLIGGCGSSLCLLIALLLFSKRRGTRNLMKLSALPMLFNINEIMVFGLPIIYNPVFLLPFILAPLVSFLVAYVAMSVGLVPVVTSDIIWTTPILFNGYLATGSIKGLILQIVNVVLGVAIYAPFVKIYDKSKAKSAQKDYEAMLEKLKESEASRTPIQLTDSALSFGWMGKALAADLEYAFAHEQLKMFYQPQYNDADECVGVEALLRWKHPNFGWIYPPLIIKLAEEDGMREKMEQWVILSVLKDARMLREKYPETEMKVSVNVTGASIQQKSFEDFLEKITAENNVKELNICLEITEQDALLLDETLRERFRHLKQLGYMLAVDDFSMGSTSIGYLLGSHFELIKLDGSLVKGILDNPRCCDIIASIVHLSDSLAVQVIAEYVSDEKIRTKLQEVGCRLYQGWYYSPAVPLEEFEELVQKEQEKNN